MDANLLKNLAVSALFVSLLPGCGLTELKQEKEANQKLRVELEQVRLEMMQSRAESEAGHIRLKASHEAATEANDRLKKELEGMRDRLDSLELENKKLKQEYDQYKADYRVRVLKNPAGMKLQDFAAMDGRSFVRPVISSRTASSLTFRHSGGVSTLNWSELPENLRKILLAGEVYSEPEKVLVASAPAPEPPPRLGYGEYLYARLKHDVAENREEDAKTATRDRLRAAHAALERQLNDQRAQLSSALRAYADRKSSVRSGGGRLATSTSYTAGGRASYASYSIASPPEATAWIDGGDMALRNIRNMRDQVIVTARKEAAAKSALLAAGGR
jgi:hypothetical protein